MDANAFKGKINASCYLLTISICFFFQLTDRFIRDLMLVIVLPLFLAAVFILAVCLKFRSICKSQQRREEVIWLEFYDEVIQWSNVWKSNSLLHCSWRLSSPWRLGGNSQIRCYSPRQAGRRCIWGSVQRLGAHGRTSESMRSKKT